MKKGNKIKIFLLTLSIAMMALAFFYVKNNPPKKIVTNPEVNVNTATESITTTSATTTKMDSYQKYPPLSRSANLKSNNNQEFCLSIPILYYHHIEPEAQAQKKGQDKLFVDANIFEQQLKYLSEKKYQTISTEALISALKEKQPLPQKTIVITLDDGYADNYEYAYRTAQKYNLIINVMLPTGLIGKDDYLTWEQIKEMKASGLVYFYNHTYSHHPLSEAKDEKVVWEINAAQTELNQELGPTPKIITYPYGSYNLQTIKLASDNGFIAGLTTKDGIRQCDSYIMELRRTRIGNAVLSHYSL